MKRIRTTTPALFLTLMLVVSSIAVIPASAAEVTTEESGAAITFEASGFGWPNNGYVTCYALSNGRVNTYSNAAATTYTGWIDGKADQCKIVGYNTSYMTFKVQYPTSKGTKTAWTKWSNFVYNTSAPKKSMTLTKAYKVYTKPDLSKQIGTAYKGDKISIVSTKGNLSQIVYPVGSNWKMGWAKLDNGSTNNNNTNTVTAKTYYVTASSGLILRKGAGTSYAKILTMPYAAAVSVTTISNGWATAKYNGYSGYCSSQYLSTTKPKTEQPKNNTNNIATSSVTAPMKNMYCTWRSYANNSWASYSKNSSGRNYHLGIDVYGTDGAVYAMADGEIVAASSSTSGANGRYIIIKHNLNGQTCYSFYAHLSSLKKSSGKVSAGQQIAVAGGSGYGKNNYYGTHLHFAVVNTLWSKGNYYGYSTYFTGNKTTYGGVTYYNPNYVLSYKKLP